ncbi:hypothetical protein TTHERM_00480160 (macronuclear) [Tetrahymena thermophila SB210]|uniref:Transmembrane protein n=1 Tax=Tetrahymena thermophila (strain SB210) TaxID=312017 RepID=I7LV44_TETTS|nr:hypothetical protein TTHERM_00480160 [Tetrahymena thermophila SB210]EAR97181.1 hypothetical protein TTHERM_00480160 [Tetrahymena thermophila SB210]|eukprot:XP_001017426.1 hypothetical protein TTHERM_00480160 [Tetrahymena thermophila SB210]
MRQSLIILIIASAFLVSFVESNQEITKYSPPKDMKILIENGLDTSLASGTFYTKDNSACFRACAAKYSNSLYYTIQQRYICCQLGYTNDSNGWLWMSCKPLILDCQGN